MTSKINQDNDENERLLKALHDAVILAHKDKLDRDGEFEYCRFEHEEPLSVEFDESTWLEYDGLDWVSDSGGTYALRFKAIGPLGDELNKAGIATTFITHLCEFKFRPTILIDENFERRGSFTGTYFQNGKRPDSSASGKVAQVTEKIDKLLILKRMKYA